MFSTLKVYMSSMLLLLAAGSKKEGFGVVSSGIIFTPSSVKISQVVQPFKSGNAHMFIS
jgi:hypothetical protein